MQGFNIILIYDCNCSKILMCQRSKEPYKGLYNLVGGKIECNEDGLAAAYREMFEETNISANNINLIHLMDFTYYCSDCYLEVYVGKIRKEVTVKGNENELFWIDAKSDFFDRAVFAGNGNIGHIIEEIKAWEEKILGN